MSKIKKIEIPQNIQLYKQKLEEKSKELIEYYTQNPKLSENEKKHLQDAIEHKVINYGAETEAYEDFFALERTSRGVPSGGILVKTAYIYNYYILSCFLYLNKIVQLPWDITFYWQEIDVANPLYKNYSIDKLVEETQLDYIKIKLKKQVKRKVV